MVNICLMKNILTKVKINPYTYLFLFFCAICGFIKNILIILILCFIHELGHVFFIKLFNYQIIKIEILPFGGFTTINQKINSNIDKDLIIAIGGVLFQVLFFLLLLTFKNNFNVLTYNLFKYYNIFIICFNLLPIVPLDGNKIMQLFLEKFFSYHLSYKLNLFFSFIILLIFALINYFYQWDNYFILSFLIFKLIMGIKNFKYIYNRFLMERYLYDLDYSKIDNHTKDIKDLRKNVYHFFIRDNKYINEKDKIEEFILKRKN